MLSMRTEYDTMGAVEVPDDAYYGAQTQRAVENFPISGKTMPPELIHAFGLVKWACAKANTELGLLQSGRSPLSEEQIETLLTACLEVAEGKFDDQFPVDVYQTGSGTSTNMNANEVITRRANEIVNRARSGSSGGSDAGATAPGSVNVCTTSIHPNDHVNLGQSSNDIFPTAIHVAVRELFDARLLPVGESCRALFRESVRSLVVWIVEQLECALQVGAGSVERLDRIFRRLGLASDQRR